MDPERAPDFDPIMVLAIQRMEFLKTSEKLLLFDLFDSPHMLASLSTGKLSALLGRTLRTDRWNPDEILRIASADERTLTLKKISYTFYWDMAFPPGLRELYDPPFLLYYRGNLPDPERPAVAVVGTRKPSGRGTGASFRLGYELGWMGIPVVSGLARGIDRAAHAGCLAGGGYTLAVMGSGVDTVYPRENRKLAGDILERGGSILSEYPPAVLPKPYHFPQRNRIISGLCRAVVIVQAPERSGALITADFALEQGRDVFVHKTGVDGYLSEGTRRLAADGAPVIGGAGEILSDWGCRPLREAPRLDETSPEGRREGDAEQTGSRLARLLSEELAGAVVTYNGDYFRSGR